mmetsp:Transcript_32869/g.64459  ORF Transcript_32869/g.64459 Transcript_32869/m.64459 type:complete len:293 (-) Transcript_32869:305-1183(-)
MALVNHRLRDLKDTILELKLPLPSTKADENEAIDGYEVMGDGEQSDEDQSDNRSDNSFTNHDSNDLDVYTAPQANPDDTKEPVDHDPHSPGIRSGSPELAATSGPARIASPSAAKLTPSVEPSENLQATVFRLLQQNDMLFQKIQEIEQRKADLQEMDRTVAKDLERVHSDIRSLLAEDVVIDVPPPNALTSVALLSQPPSTAARESTTSGGDLIPKLAASPTHAEIDSSCQPPPLPPRRTSNKSLPPSLPPSSLPQPHVGARLKRRVSSSASEMVQELSFPLPGTPEKRCM